MLQTVLPFAVATLDGRELLPADAAVSEQVATDLAALGRRQPSESVPLVAYGTVRTDLEHFLTTPPYDGIIAADERPALLGGVLARVSLPVSMLTSLDYFRQHDFHTYHHILMVFVLSSLLARDLFAGAPGVGDVIAGPVHDLGKLCVPLPILRKSGPLTRGERRLLDYHPVSGYLLASYHLGDHRHPAALVALNHHERIDGSGYPRGIGRITALEEMIAVCDVYDALLSPRPYRTRAYDNRTALEELTHMAEAGKFGWPPVKALIARNRADRPAPAQVVISRGMRGVPPAENNYGRLAEEAEPATGRPPREVPRAGMTACRQGRTPCLLRGGPL